MLDHSLILLIRKIKNPISFLTEDLFSRKLQKEDDFVFKVNKQLNKIIKDFGGKNSTQSSTDTSRDEPKQNLKRSRFCTNDDDNNHQSDDPTMNNYLYNQIINNSMTNQNDERIQLPLHINPDASSIYEE